MGIWMPGMSCAESSIKSDGERCFFKLDDGENRIFTLDDRDWRFFISEEGDR